MLFGSVVAVRRWFANELAEDPPPVPAWLAGAAQHLRSVRLFMPCSTASWRNRPDRFGRNLVITYTCGGGEAESKNGTQFETRL